METTRFPKSRGIVWLLAFMLVFPAFGFFPAPEAHAAVSGDYTYTVSGGKATITGYFGGDETVVIPSVLGGYPVVRIGEYAFCDAYGVSRVVFPDSVAGIGEGAFMFNETLNSVRFGSGLISIGDNAFYYTGLGSLTIPGSVISIGDCAFQDCYNLETVRLGSGVVSIGREAFAGGSKLTAINVDPKNRVYSSLNGVLFNKNRTQLIQYPAGKTSVTYTIPAGVSTIGECAFEGSRLTGVTIPNGVTAINDGAFAFGGLYGVNIPDSVKHLGDFAFYDCINLIGVSIGSGVTSIAENAFVFCFGVQSFMVSGGNPSFSCAGGVLFNKDKSELLLYPAGKTSAAYAVPGSVAAIGKYAFMGSQKLTSVTIPDSVVSIGEGAFYDCPKLSGVDLGNGVASIGRGAFAYCMRLARVDIPDSVTEIGDSAFEGCSMLAEAVIGNSVSDIGEYAFAYCEKLARIAIPDGVDSLGAGAFACCTGLRRALIGDGLINIPESAFDECTALRTVKLGGNLTSVGDWAFANCESLTSVTIPEAVQSVGYAAFMNCGSLSAAYFTGHAPRTQMYLFSGCRPGFAIYRLKGKTGFTNPWKGHPTAVFDPTFSHAVTFSLNGASGVPPAAQTLYDGVKAIKPGDPSSGGYVFKGWYGNAACTGPAWDFFDPVRSDVTLYAKWAPLAPTRPEGLKAASVACDRIQLSWGASKYAGGYIVYRTSRSGKILAKAATVTGKRSCTVSGLTCGSTYYFRVRAFRKTGASVKYSAYTPTVSVKPVPAAPDVQTALGPSMSVRLSWKAVGGATRYEIYRADSKTGRYSRIGSTSLLRYRDAHCTPGARYFYKVRAVRKSGSRTTAGKFSAPVSQKLALKTPSAVAHSKDYRTVRLEWSTVQAADGYEIFRKTSSKGKYIKIATVSSGNYARLDKGLTTGRAYTYKVRAFQKVGKNKVYGAFCAPVTAKPVPSAPKNLTVTRISPTRLKTAWDPVLGAAKYEVRRCASLTGTYAAVAETASCAFTDGGLDEGRKYYYKVRAYRTVGGVKVYGPYCAPDSP